MKKLAVLLLVCLPCIVNAQLNIQTHDKAYGYKNVCDIYGPFGTKVGEIRYAQNGSYFLCGITDNQFENSMATIELGSTKNSAIKSFEDLYRLYCNDNGNEEYIVKSHSGHDTHIIFSNSLLYATVIKEDGKAGVSAVLYWLFHKERKYYEYKGKILEFNENI